MLSGAPSRFTRWASAEIPGDAIARFRVAFASTWLLYDLLDLSSGGTVGMVRVFGPHPTVLTLLQAALIVSEALLLLGWRARRMAFLAFFFRFWEAFGFFRLNDFLYFCVTALILSQCRLENDPLDARKPASEPAWARDLLVWQCAWMYFASAVLKTSGPWLRGGHLFVRHRYLAEVLHWPYPAFYRALISSLSFHATLAPVVVLAELALAGLLAFRGPRRVTVPLAILLHGYAAVFLNVWFFGASMVAQVGLLFNL